MIPSNAARLLHVAMATLMRCAAAVARMMGATGRTGRAIGRSVAIAMALAGCESGPRDVRPFAMLVDSLLPALERISGLEVLAPIRTATQRPEDVADYVDRRLMQQLPEREIEGIRSVYAMLGLLPDTLDLRALLRELYAEQIAGYYDPETKTLYVVEGTPAGLRPVLAHELVHAIQDQHTNLDSLIARTRGNDRQTAAQAAIEGHATLTMFALLAEESTGQPIDPAAMPDFAAQIRSAFETQITEFPVFGRAPRVIRETMLFPYADGAAFVQALWRQRGPDNGPAAPFGSLLPQSTEQVLDPARFLPEPDAPTELRFEAAAEWRAIFENTLGQFETRLFLEEHAGPMPLAAAGWDGDRYVLLESMAGDRLLVWVSVWDAATQADSFGRMASFAMGAPPMAGRGRVERFPLEGRPAVRILIAEPAVLDASDTPLPEVFCADEAGVRVPCGMP